jgi:oligoribonuclease
VTGLSPSHPPLIWLDMEMTGLDPERCQILEVATLITDHELNIVATGPDLVIHCEDEILDGMDPWCIEHHGRSGLTEASRKSTISLELAQAQTVAFIGQYCQIGQSPLCGNSIGQDRRFIARYMPELDRCLHYRSIDVSTIKELARRWYPQERAPQKKEGHRALDDILESLEELRFYRRAVFRAP